MSNTVPVTVPEAVLLDIVLLGRLPDLLLLVVVIATREEALGAQDAQHTEQDDQQQTDGAAHNVHLATVQQAFHETVFRYRSILIVSTSKSF